jgi:hypothetical protein
MMAAALLLNTASLYLVVRDHQMVVRWLSTPAVAPSPVIVTLEGEFDLRLASRLIVSAILIFGALVILAIERKLRRSGWSRPRSSPGWTRGSSPSIAGARSRFSTRPLPGS